MLRVYTNAVLGFWSVLFVALLLFNVRECRLVIHPGSTAFMRFLLPALLAALCVCVVRSSLQTRLVVANLLVATMVAFYAAEFFLAHRLVVREQRAAQQSGKPFDRRDKVSVIRDMRGEGIDAYPVMRAENMLVADRRGVLRPVLSSNGHPLLPLASIPRTTVVSCNESGQWQIYQADRHGFHNPDSQWDGRPAIGMVGDSFTHGSCVRSDEDMAALLRKRFTGVVNLGVGGFGPLLELAALTEYLRPLQPPIVLWVFFEGNDLTEDLPNESRSPLLRAYLQDDTFSQNLIGRREEVETALHGYLDRQLTAAMNREDNPYEDMARFVSLDRTREAIGLGHVEIGYNLGNLKSELTLFEQILRKADQRVGAWGGRLYLVYLPESARYVSKFGDSANRQAIYQGVRRIAARQHIPMIDVAAAFADDPSPDTLYAYPGAHCSPKGYRLAAKAIARGIGWQFPWLSSR